MSFLIIWDNQENKVFNPLFDHYNIFNKEFNISNLFNNKNKEFIYSLISIGW